MRWQKLSRLRNISGKECLKIICNKFGFVALRQNGSHVICVKETPNGKVGTVVPMHKELKLPTLRNILKLAKIDEDEFAEHV